MKRLTNFIDKHTSGKKVLGLFILTNSVYIIMLTVTIPKTMEFSNGMKLLDMMPSGYDLNYVNELFSTLGENGRATYLTNQIPMGMIYPLLFGLSYCLLLGYFLKKLNKLHIPYLYLCILPLIAGISDYLENTGIIIMLNHYPDLTETMVNTSHTFTILKSISTTVFFIALIIILILLGLKFLKSNKKSANTP
ncbi:hypothetical protein [Algibacter mikhailovii]|uniref:Uncharacterized protein n=1 Tax=Algibacter mikhailovii TaxID=425498 RepID=A0A918RAX1_9FLAO|nr:hypothetical protein [Algibacter mikhailovii]GGZ92443.1 hypothetical protein GCM10007028_33440 [Algibacter mikhailovii]